MLVGLNKAYLMGRAGRDAEMRAMAPSGTPVCKVSICTPTARRVDGQLVEDVDWHNLVGYNAIAEAMAGIRKGVGFMVECKISQKKWTDREGKIHYQTDLVVTKVLWIDGVSSVPDLGEPPLDETPFPEEGS